MCVTCDQTLPDLWPDEKVRNLFASLHIDAAPESRMKQRDWDRLQWVREMVRRGQFGEWKAVRS